MGLLIECEIRKIPAVTFGAYEQAPILPQVLMAVRDFHSKDHVEWRP